MQVFKEGVLDLTIQINALENTIEGLRREVEFYKRNTAINIPKEMRAIDYSSPIVSGGQQPLELKRALSEIVRIEADIERLTELTNIKKESRDKVKEVLKNMTGTKWEVAYMKLIEGASVKEIAEKLNIDYQYAKNISCEINKELKMLL